MATTGSKQIQQTVTSGHNRSLSTIVAMASKEPWSRQDFFEDNRARAFRSHLCANLCIFAVLNLHPQRVVNRSVKRTGVCNLLTDHSFYLDFCLVWALLAVPAFLLTPDRTLDPGTPVRYGYLLASVAAFCLTAQCCCFARLFGPDPEAGLLPVF